MKPKARRDYCPKGSFLSGYKHSFDDYTYWGSRHPMCHCGYEDKTRLLEHPIMKIRKSVLNGKQYTYVSSEDVTTAKNLGLLKVNCCPFCKIERNRDVHSRGGSWSGDWCPECNAKEIIDEWQR